MQSCSPLPSETGREQPPAECTQSHHELPSYNHLKRDSLWYMMDYYLSVTVQQRTTLDHSLQNLQRHSACVSPDNILVSSLEGILLPKQK